MKTKVKILGANNVEQPKKRKIEFVHVLKSDGELTPTSDLPSIWSEITLIYKDYALNLDLMFGKGYEKENRPNHCGLYLGHFNDGIV